MKIADFRIQSTSPDSPVTNVLGVYVNSSGILVTKTSAGVIAQLGAQYTGAVAQVAVATGVVVNDGDNLGLSTGVYFGVNNGSAQQQTGLGTPVGWLPVVGPAGQNWVIPAYSLK